MKLLLPHRPRLRAFTLVELLVVIAIIAILAGFAMGPIHNALMRARLTNTANNAHQIALAFKSYAMAHDGAFPVYVDIDDPTAKFANSNAAMESLMPKYCPDKAVFYNGTSKWCHPTPASPQTRYKVAAGDNDWAYVRGLSEGSDPCWPLLATAFAPGSTEYVKDQGKPGGVWRGETAVVLRVDGSVKVENCAEKGDRSYPKRADKPSKSQFEKDEDWLSGEDIEVLNPAAY